mgnify:FL=1
MVSSAGVLIISPPPWNLLPGLPTEHADPIPGQGIRAELAGGVSARARKVEAQREMKLELEKQMREREERLRKEKEDTVRRIPCHVRQDEESIWDSVFFPPL